MKWLTPKAHYIHGKGIKPDVKISEPAYQSLNVIPNKKVYKLNDTDKMLRP